MHVRSGVWVGLSLLLGLAFACTPAAPPAAPAVSDAAAPLKARVGILPSVAAGPIYVASERGYFAEMGLDVELAVFDTAPRLIAPLAANQLDVAAAAISAGLFDAVSRLVDVRFVADRGSEAPGQSDSGLVVRQDLWEGGAVRTLADVRGRRVGLFGAQTGSAPTVALGHALETRGLRLDDLDVSDLPLAELNAGLANRSLDAAMQAEPLLALGVHNRFFSVLQRSDELYPGLQTGFVLYTADFARNRSEAGRRWMVAYLKGVRDYHAAFFGNDDRERDAVREILIRSSPVKDRAVYRQVVAPYVDPNGRLNVATLVEAQDWFAARGYLNHKADLATLVDAQFVEHALGVLGEAR